MLLPRIWIFRALSLLVGGGAFLLLTEIVFRSLLPVSDIPYWIPDNKLGYRHPSGVEGRFITSAHAARYRLNNRGWNNPDDYVPSHLSDVHRIAIVGDSYVEALQVDVDKGLGPQLARLLVAENARVEVFTYGISGASTAYALELIRNEVRADQPDLIVYLFINNDVADNVDFLGSGSRPGPHFDLSIDGGLRELPLVKFEPKSWSRLFSKMSTFRYFWVNRGLGTAWQSGHLLEWLRGKEVLVNDFESGIYESDSAEWRKAWEVTGSLMEEMRRIASDMGAKFLVINAPHPANFYPVATQGDINRPEAHLVELSRAHGFLFCDLRDRFRRDWEEKHERFDYPSDSHWNEHGHRVAALALQESISEHWPELLVPKRPSDADPITTSEGAATVKSKRP